ncbi:uncharacterized protein LOC127859521 [Dreissena polymorpha]|uniref:uncharacterized protein LOC127859521 n=1 Tax=Dreissena polymorpha TaxID=45954 RepID=UPI002264BEA7|nr:uncharacterized protein LOC127859521 [Dreissena polymorpha]
MVKRCCYGTCNSDTRYPERLIDGTTFIPFPKPGTSLEKCKRWIRLCGRPHEQLNLEILSDRPKAKHVYVCSKHFDKENPDPRPATSYEMLTPVRPPPKIRPLSEPPRKKARTVLTQSFSSNEMIHVSPQTPIVTETVRSEIQEPPTNEKSTESLGMNMLALAAENEQLKRHLAKLILDKENILRKEQDSTSSQEPAVTSTNIAPTFSCESLRKNTKYDEFIYYTGLNHSQFEAFMKFILPVEKPFSMKKNLTCLKTFKMEDQLLMVLIKLRQNFDFKHIGKLFGISMQDASYIFNNWIQYMFHRCGSVPIWPHRNTIIANMPPRYREEFPTTLVIIDGTELRIQKPSSLTRQSQCYSDYKSCNTLKGLVGIDPRGSIIFSSMLFAGSISDKELTAQSGFLDQLKALMKCGKIHEGDGVMVDKGFKIKDELDGLGLNLNIPPFATSGLQMSQADIAATEKIARHRVHVERAIARVKNFKILSNRIDLSLFATIDQIWFVSCFITNFMGFLIK